MALLNFVLRGKRMLFLGLICTLLLAGCSGLFLGQTGEPVELTFVYLENAADYEPLAQAFHKAHPNITIKLDPVPLQGNVSNELVTRMKEADTVRLPVTIIQPEMAAGFLPLDTQTAASKTFPAGDLYPGLLDGLKQDGKLLGIPAGLDPFVVYYTPSRFQAAGVQPPSPSWTLEEFVTAADAVNNPDEKLLGTPNFAYGFCSHPSFADAVMFTYMFGGGLFDSLNVISKPMLNQPANVQALDWYVGLKINHNLMPTRNRPEQVAQLISHSACGFWFDTLDHAQIYGPIQQDDAAPLPLPAYKGQFNVVILDGYFILANSQHPEESWQWINFLMSEQSASGRLIPPLRSQLESMEYSNRVTRAVVDVARSLPPQLVVLGLEIYRNERFGQVLGLFNQATEKVLSGEMDAQKALDAAQQQAEALLK